MVNWYADLLTFLLCRNSTHCIFSTLGTPTGLGNFLHATGDTGISSGPSYSKEKTKFSDSKQFELSEANQSAKESTNVEPEVRGELQSVSHDTGSPSKGQSEQEMLPE